MSLNSSALRASDVSSRSSAGSSRRVDSSSAARCTALGNTSLEDWPMLTWSLACTPSPASVAMTSLAFMFDEVPEPVWKTSIGNWWSWRPCAISSAAAAMRWARSASSSPRSAFVRAAAPLMRPSQRTTATGTRSPEIGKLSTAFVVSPPHSWCLVSTLIGTNLQAERRDLARQPDGVVVGHQVAGPGQDPQLGVGKQVQCLLGDGDGMGAVLVGPQQQRRAFDV